MSRMDQSIINRFLIGCCYYPEHWDDGEMRGDLARIRSLGFNVIRMGEFSWSMYEPEEGKYDFTFLQDAVRVAGELGLDVILGTPTAAPPKWLIDKHPEVLCVDAKRTVMQHGSRQHHNHTSPIYLRYCAAITEKMVKAFADFENVIGWQIDNEINCHRNASYSEADDLAFAKWLEKKYTTVDALNRAWGNRFWSLEFNSFSQITCPRPNPAHNNPSWVTDYYLFLSDSAVDYAAVQTRIIRKYCPNAFITHNGYFKNLDYRRLTNECLDILSFDSYPAGSERSWRGASRYVAYKLALTRAYSEKHLILEQQAGPGGQLSYMHPTPRPGQIRLWVYQSIAHGAVGVLYFRYRTALYGAEQLWYGIYDHDREENYRSQEVRKISEELARVGDLFLTERMHNDVAIFRNYHNESVDAVESFAADDSWYVFRSLNRRNVHADFVDETVDFSKYKVLIIPHITIADEALAAKVKQFTDNGGIAIISARSGVKDQNAHYYPQKAPGVFRSLAGCRVDWFTAMPTYESQSAVVDGKEYKVETYYELLETDSESAERIGFYTEDFCKDKTAVVRNGNVYYVGFYCREASDLYVDLVARYIPIEEPIDPKLETVRLGSYKMHLNHANYEVACEGYDLLSESSFQSIPPYGVVLVKATD